MTKKNLRTGGKKKWKNLKLIKPGGFEKKLCRDVLIGEKNFGPKNSIKTQPSPNKKALLIFFFYLFSI